MTTSDDEQKTVDYGTVLRDVWDNATEANVDADCSPTKVCRNARDFTFDGIAEGSDDVATSWRKLLEREGKLASSDTASLRDLVLGSPPGEPGPADS
ncbi:MAG: hypothetical protein HKN24_14205 [Acidimicrobiales bacterium]|nr:hypothetical protein [Acidimicrobiales bacterium]